MKPTYRLLTGDARQLDWLLDESVHLVVTSPPYWTLKEYNEHPDQLGAVADYDCFMDQLDQVWKHCLRALVAGGRLVCVVGDVCLSRKKNRGRHMVVPLHADISVRCRQIGFDYLTPIFWHKIANAKYEVENGSSFLGKPFEPNAIIKNDCEYILMFRKPGGYRQPTEEQRRLSRLSKEEHARWFRKIWTECPALPREAIPRRSPKSWRIAWCGCSRSSATPCPTRSRARAPRWWPRWAPIATALVSNATSSTPRWPSGASRPP